MGVVDRELGAIARPKRVHFVVQPPKVPSGKVRRRSIQAIAEGRDPGDFTSLDDAFGIEQIKNAVAKGQEVPCRGPPLCGGGCQDRAKPATRRAFPCHQ